MNEQAELFTRFEQLGRDLKRVSGIVQNPGVAVNAGDSVNFTDDVNSVLNELNKLKIDVLEYYGHY